jgi:transaldolase
VTVQTLVDGPLLRTTRDSATDLWNDSCDVDELAYAIERGATGATSNPTIVLDVLRRDTIATFAGDSARPGRH